MLRVALALAPMPILALLVALLGDSDPRAGSTSAGSPVVAGGGPSPGEPVLRHDLVAAYERSRRATWLIVFDFTRELRDGRRLELRLAELNRPPDHLTAGFGGVNGRVGGREVVCGEVEGETLCAPRGPAVPFEDELATELAEFRDALWPPARWYAVAAGEPRTVLGRPTRCFVLRRVVDVPAPPYGEEAEYCFGRRDGAPLYNRIERREGTDERVAVEARREVSEADVAALLAGEVPVPSPP